ncbi:MAG: hypothetical protein ACOYXT_09140 [Bacteroidota bacterium]
MNRPLKFLLFAIIGLLALQFVISIFFVSPRLKASLQKLEEAQMDLDSARREVQFSRQRIDSIQLSLLKYNNYLLAIQGHVEVLYKDRELREVKFKASRDSILREMQQLRSKVDTIALPPLQLYDTRQQ